MTGEAIPEDDGIQVADMKAIRAEGRDELRALMRAQIAIGKARREPPAKPATPKPPGHRPGAWPTGTSPPGPAPERSLPPEVWADAVRRYRTEQRQLLDEENQ
ncbi:hypothetical protein [Streptomyces chartreusis]|uniref:hypothetical protein n=1 Tax=Streptomyces chartreusis TaxID=1969 RepID=UPI00123D4D96|nr:hypothetical protein [Streptomyces chartreusis]QEV66260.1 hypothetical protein CP983_05990 [Streptomyces chartreusis]GGW99035.1 hypothetical protein GCM10010321_11880 [Streptomyces chartreusis]